MSSRVFKKIRKRNGRLHKFRPEKIEKAIASAGRVSGEFDEKTAIKLSKSSIKLAIDILGEDSIPTVEEIQDIVEDTLLNSEYHKAAKEYILYRDQRERVREISASFNRDMINQYLDKSDWRVSENSNVGFSLSGLNNFISSNVSKVYWLNEIYPREIRDAHSKGIFHIHDLSTLSTYCVGWDLWDLLVEGFKGVSGQVQSSPPKHLGAALGQMVNFIFTLQNEAAGAQAFSNVDTLLAPFIRYDKMKFQQVKQVLQEFIFNMNVNTRQGGQSPFSNITLDLVPSPALKDQNVIIGGKPMEEKYSDFQAEMDTFNRALFEVMLEGDARGRVFTFPIPTYNITKDFDWDNPNVKLLWEITARYGIPYFSNFINSDMKPEDSRSMCCRLRIDNRELTKKGGGLFGANPLTGSTGVVTINMPRLANESSNGWDFMRNLKSAMDLAKESLEIKRDILEEFTDKGLYPYTKFYLRSVKKRFKKYWANHFSTIGLVGMNEACINLFDEDISSKRGAKFAAKVLDYMRNRLVQYQKETGNHYNLEATPAEGTSYSLALKDKKKDPKIKCANEESWACGAEPFYSNSTQLPVGFTDDIFKVLDLQDNLQTKYTGGTTLHLFIGEKIDDPEAVKKLVKVICENYSLPYFTITPTFSICPVHGYIAGEHEYCPKCDEGIEEELNKKGEQNGAR